MPEHPEVAVIMGSDSDLPIVKNSFEILKKFKIPFEVKIFSAHRSPDELKEFILSSEANGIKVIIAAAGGAAHLPGVIASHTVLPVIGIPIKSKSLNGMDSLLSIVQMPSGVPVATVSIDGAKNAAILAAQIIATRDKALLKRLKKFKDEIRKASLAKNDNLNLT